MSSPHLILGARVLLGCVLCATAVAKLQHLGNSAGESGTLIELAVRSELVQVLAAAIELVVALSLATRAWKWGLRSTVVLTIIFLVVMLALVLSGVPMSACGCFGVLPLSPVNHVLFAASLGLTALCALALASQGNPTRGELAPQAGRE